MHVCVCTRVNPPCRTSMRWPVLSIVGFKLVAEVGVIVTPVTDGQLEKLPDSEDWFTL